MAWPPPVPPATRANTTPQLDTHPADHNAISAALTELVARAQNQAPYIRIASGSTTTDGNGFAAFLFAPAFPAGHVPLVIPTTGLDNVHTTVTAVSVTGFTCRLRRLDDSLVASIAVSVNYLAVAN